MLNSLSLFQLLVGLALTLNLAQAAPTEQKVHKMSLRRVPVPRDHTVGFNSASKGNSDPFSRLRYKNAKKFPSLRRRLLHSAWRLFRHQPPNLHHLQRSLFLVCPLVPARGSKLTSLLAKGSNGNGFNPDQYLPGNGAGPFVDHVSNITVGGGGLHGLAITDMGPDWSRSAFAFSWLLGSDEK